MELRERQGLADRLEEPFQVLRGVEPENRYGTIDAAVQALKDVTGTDFNKEFDTGSEHGADGVFPENCVIHLEL